MSIVRDGAAEPDQLPIAYRDEGRPGLRGEPVLEFGLRRAQGVDGALAASRAAYIGGCAATSNVLAAKLYGIPARGTHAHSWVMSFDDEREAFRAYAEAMPNNCVFLVDTYNTLEGVRRAVEVGRLLRERGHEMVGIRLDSGDLAWLSVEARKILDAAGFPNAVIVASNDLDEHIIASLKEQGAMINVWGVGTKLVTADSAAVSCLVSLACELALNELGRDGVRIKLGHIRNLPKELTPRSLTNALLTTFYQATENSGPITRAAARAVAEAVGATHFEFDLGKLHRGYLETVESALGRKFDWESDDLALQNIQARVRSPGIWMLANVRNALLLATSNRSEAAVGYATMDGDTSGGLSPIAGIDKAFLGQWLRWMQASIHSFLYRPPI